MKLTESCRILKQAETSVDGLILNRQMLDHGIVVGDDKKESNCCVISQYCTVCCIIVDRLMGIDVGALPFGPGKSSGSSQITCIRIRRRV